MFAELAGHLYINVFFSFVVVFSLVCVCVYVCVWRGKVDRMRGKACTLPPEI